MEEMAAVASATPVLAGRALERAQAALAMVSVDRDDEEAARREFAALMEGRSAVA
jgi:hypothetical protein